MPYSTDIKDYYRRAWGLEDRPKFKFGGSWADWETNFSDQMTFEEYLRMDIKEKKPHALDRKADGGRIGFDEGTKPILPRDKFIELRIKYKNTHNNAEFAELLNKDWKPAQADVFHKDNVTKRIADSKHLFPKEFDYKGSNLERAVTEKQMIELWGNEKYQEHKKNYSSEKLKEKYTSDAGYKKLPTEKKYEKVKKTQISRAKRLAAMSPEDRKVFLDKEAVDAAARTAESRGQKIKFDRNPKKFKSVLWADLVKRTYENYSAGKKPGGLEPPPFKFSEESLKLIKSKPALNRVDMEKIVLIDKNNKPFNWDTLESYVKEGNALNSKGQPMSWDEVTKSYKIKEFVNKEGFTQKINKATIPNYNPVKDINRSGWHIAHNTSFNQSPWETHIAPWKANLQEGRARTRFLNLWDGSNAEFKEGKITKEDRFKLRKQAVSTYYKTMEPITEIKYSLGKKQHGAATPIEDLFKKAGLNLNAEDTTKLSRTIQSIMSKKNSGLNVVDIARWGSAELSALDDIAGKIPSKALSAFGKLLKFAGIASIPLDVVPFVQARDLGIDNWGTVGGKNLAEMYTNLPGMIWEAGEWVASKVQGKEHEWKPFYEKTFGQRATAKALRETSVEDLIKNITAQGEEAKKMHVGQQVDATWSEEKLNKRIEAALKQKEYYDSLPDDHDLIKEEVKDMENISRGYSKDKFMASGGLSGVDQYILNRYK